MLRGGSLNLRGKGQQAAKLVARCREALVMCSSPQSMPLCSRLLSPDEVENYLRLAAMRGRLAGRMETILPAVAGPLDRDELRGLEDETARHREFLWAVLPGDRVWITTDPPRHPETEYGVPHLVVVRGGRPVFRYRLDPGAGPVLPPATTRLTREEAVALASEWVRARYPVVPPVTMAQIFADHEIDALERRTGTAFTPGERADATGRWSVAFACSWDTDAQGMPSSLLVLIDDATGRVYSPASGDTV
jgi:hypothetical protein